MNIMSHGNKKDLITEDLIQLESYIRSFWEFLPIPVCYVNPAFNILEISKSFENLLGYSTLEIVGENLKKFFKSKKEFFELQKELQENLYIENKEIYLLSKDNREIPINSSGKARTDEEGNVVGYFLAFLDITERKKFEESLKEKIEELEKFHKLTVGRELRMIELKEKIKELEERLKEKET